MHPGLYPTVCNLGKEHHPNGLGAIWKNLLNGTIGWTLIGLTARWFLKQFLKRIGLLGFLRGLSNSSRFEFATRFTARIRADLSS